MCRHLWEWYIAVSVIVSLTRKPTAWVAILTKIQTCCSSMQTFNLVLSACVGVPRASFFVMKRHINSKTEWVNIDLFFTAVVNRLLRWQFLDAGASTSLWEKMHHFYRFPCIIMHNVECVVHSIILCLTRFFVIRKAKPWKRTSIAKTSKSKNWWTILVSHIVQQTLLSSPLHGVLYRLDHV